MSMSRSTGVIAVAIVNSKSVIIYDKLGKKSGQIAFHSGDRLVGYTDSAVSILSGQTVYVYSELGKLLFSVHAGVVAGGGTGTSTNDGWQST
jgi:hypothetical protein